MIETHLSFANTWECDENGHVNVQFFLKRFDEAFEVFSAKSELVENPKPSLTSRHVRFHNEVHVADSLKIESGIIANGEFAGQLGHRLFNTNSGKLCTTALDSIKGEFGDTSIFDKEHLSEVIPRGLPADRIDPIDADPLIQKRKAMVTSHSVISPNDLDKDGAFLTNRIISMFSDGAPHIWERAGVSTNWLNENNFGRVAVEIKLCPIDIPELGAALQLISRISEIDGRTFRIDHQIEEIASKRVIACGSVRCLVMSLETRRAVSLPDTMTMDC